MMMVMMYDDDDDDDDDADGDEDYVHRSLVADTVQALPGERSALLCGRCRGTGRQADRHRHRREAQVRTPQVGSAHPTPLFG